MLHEQLTTLFKRSGFSRRDVAAEIGVSPQCLGHWLNGYREPRFDHLSALLRSVGATSEDIAKLFDPAPGRSIPEGWTPVVLLHQVEQGGDRKVALTLAPAGHGWVAVAVESDGGDIAAVLDHHAHALIAGPGPLDDVVEACRVWLAGWRNRLPAPECACSEAA